MRYVLAVVSDINSISTQNLTNILNSGLTALKYIFTNWKIHLFYYFLYIAVFRNKITFIRYFKYLLDTING